MEPSVVNVLVIGLVVFVAVMLLVKAVRIVPEYQRLIVFRLGRALGARGPGLVLLIPFVDRGVVANLRERFFDVPPQTTITADNAHLSIDFLVYSKVVDALSSVLNVEHYEGASRDSITTLRAVVGSMALDDVLAKREAINDRLRGKLDEVTNRWGIKVTAVESGKSLRREKILEAMTRQMSAERSRRAMVTEADGQRSATIQLSPKGSSMRPSSKRRALGKRPSSGRRASLHSRRDSRRRAQARRQDDEPAIPRRCSGHSGRTRRRSSSFPLELAGLVRPFVEHIAGASASAEPVVESRH